jgi:putrescine---pyruvate transaminase
MKYKGLIPNRQQSIFSARPHWQYGEIRDGRKIIDPILHYGCFVLGYHNDEIVDYVSSVVKNNKPEIAETIIESDDLRLNHISFDFADRVHSLTGMIPFFALSGSDANEGAIKLASAYQYLKGNHNKNIIVGFEKSYHGSTWLTMSVGSDNLLKRPFYTLPPYQAVTRIPRNFELDVIDWSSVAAIMVETCSYGQNMTPPSDEFWMKIEAIRKEYDVLIIIDDIFMGGGKTGDYVGWKNLPITPDISTMGKAITAGFFPLSMVLYNEKIDNVLPADFRWEHGFTYNFSLAGIASAMKYLDILEREDHLSRHDQLIDNATTVITDCGFEIINRFGLHYMISKQQQKYFYLIPVNATDEYFQVLRENLCRS